MSTHCLCIWLVFCCYYLHSLSLTEALDCALPKQEWMKLRYTSMLDVVPATAPTNVCSISGESCCDQHMERMMFALGQRHVVHQASLNWLRVADQMNNDSATLEHFFRTDLEQAKDRLHQFFSRIYGYNYKLHRRFFFQFFSDLEAYMAGQRSRLDHLVENFFNQLRDSIVGLIERSGQGHSGSNPNFPTGTMSSSTGGSSSGSYSSGMLDEAAETRRIRCLSDRVAQLRPFDEVDVRLKARMLEAYPPLRMLINVLSVSSRLLSHLARQVGEKPDCVVGMARFQFCAICAGKRMSSVCPDSCSKLLSSCLRLDAPSSGQLEAIWPRLIDAIVMAVMRLERSFNFPVVNRQLQMEISEAITSLQTRYEQTKSKFESECRTGGGNRNVPTLFSSVGSNNRMLPPNSQPSLSGWPSNPSGFRGKRQARAVPHQVRQVRQMNPSFASPELLHWQTRQGMPHANQFGPPSNNYGQRAPHTGYGLPTDNAPRPMWEPPVNEATSDVPERLMRWAVQAKHAYTGLRNLFAVPGASFCPSGSITSHTNGTNATADCWNPPAVVPTSQDYGISKTLRVLFEATERLHQAANNNADPEALSLSPATIGPPAAAAPAMPFAPRRPEPPSYNAPGHPVTNRPFTPQNQWAPQPAPGQFNDFETWGNRNQPPQGSGFEPANWYTAPPPEQHSAINYYRENLPGPTTPAIGAIQPLPYGDPMPHAGGNLEAMGSGYGEYQPYPPYEPEGTEAPPRAPDQSQDLRIDSTKNDDRWSVIDHHNSPPPFQQPESTISSTRTPTTSTTVTITSTLSQDPVTSPISSTPVLNTTTTDTTPTITTTTSVPVPSTSASTEAPIVVPPVPYWRAPYNPQITAPPVEPPTQPPRNAYPDVPRYGNLPDDEDNVFGQGYGYGLQQFGPTSPPPFQQPWTEAPGPQSQGEWWKDPYSEGSGFGGTGQGTQVQPITPIHPGSNYGSELRKPESSIPEAPIHYYPGSGQGPIQPQPYQGFPGYSQFTDRPAGSPFDSPNENRQTSWSKYIEDPVQPYPAHPGSGLGENAWVDNQPHGLPDGLTPWQQGPAGSGASDPVNYPPTPEVQPQTPPVETRPQLPVLHPIGKPKPSMPLPPLPPPEVWVPAQLAPGQPIPPVLLVREYNVQEPFYGPEVMQNKPSLASFCYPVATLFAAIATLQCMLNLLI